MSEKEQLEKSTQYLNDLAAKIGLESLVEVRQPAGGYIGAVTWVYPIDGEILALGQNVQAAEATLRKLARQ